jgi:acetolactate synthase-1/2/3 large subunit
MTDLVPDPSALASRQPETNIEAGGPQPHPARGGAEAITETLKACNVEMVFGYSGGGTGPLVNAIEVGGVRNMNARTELSGAWMSYGYNRMRRRAASACVFHVIGSLHASPVVHAAKVDGTPFFLMPINLDAALDFREGLQTSVDEIYPALKPLAKYCKRAVSPSDLPLAVRQSIIAASTGRPGAAVLDIPYNALVEPTSCPVEPLTLPEPPAASDAALERILAMIARAERPVIFAGAGVHMADAAAELQEFAELLGLPIVSTSWGGRGLVSDDHPLFAGVVGSFGWNSANEMVQTADLWFAVGTTFSQMTTGAWNIDKPENVIHVDVDPNQIGKIFQPALGVTADAKQVLSQLIKRVRAEGLESPASDDRLAEIAAGKREWSEYHEALSGESGVPINQYYLIREMSKAFPPGTIMVSDSGGHAFMLFRSFHYKEFTPMALGSRYMSLGAGLPVAIGAKLAEPDRTVVCYHGDGGFYYDFMELSTLAERKMKVIVILDNNHCLYANRQGMKMWGIQNPWCELPETTDFVALAKSLGVDGEQVTRPEDIAPALQRAVASEGSYIIDVVTDPETRIRRAIRDVIPILSDRQPPQSADGHPSPPLEQSWPK